MLYWKRLQYKQFNLAGIQCQLKKANYSETCTASFDLIKSYTFLPSFVALCKKLDWVGPIDNRPISFTNLSKNLLKKLWHFTHDMWHVTCDIWHVTRDMWHMACDLWHVTCDMLWGVNILSKSQLPRSYGLWFMISWRLGEKGSRTDWINYEGVGRTAPVTLGLLNRAGWSQGYMHYIKFGIAQCWQVVASIPKKEERK